MYSKIYDVGVKKQGTDRQTEPLLKSNQQIAKLSTEGELVVEPDDRQVVPYGGFFAFLQLSSEIIKNMNYASN